MRSSAEALGRERKERMSRRVEWRRLAGSSDWRGGARALAVVEEGSVLLLLSEEVVEVWDVVGRRSTRLGLC